MNQTHLRSSLLERGRKLAKVNVHFKYLIENPTEILLNLMYVLLVSTHRTLVVPIIFNESLHILLCMCHAYHYY